ncbi:chemotaxis protein methyltransferase CheR [Rheinheimera pacifica]|uniref:CheR family methyltransferase n=1 Tax=Rheinheimera pacifica TaxID=173990 RepID=UPI002860F32E|nr:CheR family methyltransferase [Rheinheimera pacifica]MDR6983538.1 chemotaxis protein methyltransferase CheR [Rheinheimera pacifica]
MPFTTAPAEPGLNPDILRHCNDLLSARLGVHFPSERLTDLGWHVMQLLDHMGLPNVDALLVRLQQPVWPSLMQQQLVEQLTVGETYFFRDPALFQYLQQHWLPPLLAQRRREGDLRLRIWSAGCCSGEEVYSLAAVVQELLPDAGHWDLQFIGTDINPLFLQCAKAGVYRSWSFRQPDTSWRDRYCSKDSNGEYHIVPALRRGVSFFPLNLTEAVYPDALRRLANCDLILCRNVLMYFKPEQAGNIICRLLRCLTAQGVLLLAPAEAILCQAAGVRGQHWPEAISLQRHRPTMLAGDAARADAAQPVRAVSLPVPALVLPLADINQALTQARNCANRGAYASALRWVRQAIAMDKLQPGSYWLLANIEWENNNIQAALQALRQALYLEPDFVLAHFLSARLYDCLVQIAQASLHYDICLSLLDTLPPNQELEQGEGLTVAQCRQGVLMARQARQQRSTANVQH